MLEQRDLGRAQILIEYLTQIETGMPRDIALDLLRRNGLVPKVAIQSTQYRTPFRIVVHHLPDRVQHVAALVVHIARPFALCSIRADDRAVVPDIATAAD